MKPAIYYVFAVLAVAAPYVLKADIPTLEPMPEGARAVLFGYSKAEINADVEQLRRYLHPSRLGKDSAAVDGLEKVYKKLQEMQGLPERMQYGKPEYFEDTDNRLYFVPYVAIQRGIPADVRIGRLYIVVSNDAGKTWKIVSNDCGMSEALIKQLAPGYKGVPSLKSLYGNAKELADNP